MKAISLWCLALVFGITGCKHAESTGAAEAAGTETVAAAGTDTAKPADPAKPAEPAAPTPKKTAGLPKGVDAKDLDEAERKVLAEILTEQFDPCGKSRSFHDALEAGDCPIAGKLAAKLVQSLQDGLGKRAVVEALLREIERLNTVVVIDTTGAPVKGPADAKVVVVEFSDFECPFCQRAVGPIAVLQKHYGFRLNYKNYPLKLSHPNAEGAAKAAWAAHQQGKFWELHDLMFANNLKLDWNSVKGYAAKSGLDMAKFEADFASPAAQKSVDTDVAHGEAAGVDGTPTFFVNGRKAESMMQIEELVRDAMAEAKLPVPPALSAAELGEAAPSAAAAPTTAAPADAGAPANPAAPANPVPAK
jgi:protein-disulfide isomerase